MILLTDEELYEELDLLVDTDPVELRNVAWGLYLQLKKQQDALNKLLQWDMLSDSSWLGDASWAKALISEALA